MSKRISLLILVLGLIFSSILRIKFNLNDGFQFHGIGFNLVPMPILDFGGFSGIESLSSTIIG